MDSAQGEVVQYWRGIIGTLHQRGLLRERPRGGGVILPEAYLALLLPDRCVFALDMHRLGGIPREQWLDPALWRQIRAALQGRRVFVSDGAGLAITVAREPGLRPRKRLPVLVPLSRDQVPEADYRVALGVGRKGQVELDLAGRNRAILTAGWTGSGKSNLMQSVILQLALKHPPEEFAVAIVDPKRVDFGPLTPFNRLPHLFAPTAHELDDGGRLVGQVVNEFWCRQAVMAAAGVADWRSLPAEARVPLLLLVVDEVANFVRTPTMDLLVKLAREARAMGISLLIGTQHPTTDVLSSQVKANLTTAIAFQTRTANESRTVLGRGGAESLRAVGRALSFVGGEWQTVQTLRVDDGVAADFAGQVTAPPPPALDEVEAALVTYAIEELDGCFKIGALYAAIKSQQGALSYLNGVLSKDKLAALGRAWEQRGWLTEPAHATDPRRVTDELVALLNASNARPTLLDLRGDERPGVVPEHDLRVDEKRVQSPLLHTDL